MSDPHKRDLFWAGVALVLALLYLGGYRNPVLGDDCFTDTCVHAMCAKEHPHWTYDDCEEFIFGPRVDGRCADLPPDHPDHCEEE